MYELHRRKAAAPIPAAGGQWSRSKVNDRVIVFR